MGEVILCTEPSTDPNMFCVLQEGMHMDNQPVWACTHVAPSGGEGSSRSGSVQMMAEPVDVSDLGLTMTDLEDELPEGLLGEVELSGWESTSRLENSLDQGCEWEEGVDRVNAVLTIPGLRGQPSMAVAADMTSETVTVTVFGTAVWSCVLRGEIEVDQSSFEVIDGVGASTGIPVLRLAVKKRSATAMGVLPRWQGFIKDIGEDSLLQ